MDELRQNQTNIGSPDAEPMKNPPGDLRYAAERPMAVWVFGVLNIAVGCYQLIPIFLLFYKIVTVYKNSCSIGGLSYILLASGISVGLSIWLIVLGIGLLRMKKWSRRGSVIYSWVQIVLCIVVWGYTTVIILSGMANPPRGGRWPFWIIYALRMLIGLIYPVTLLIFMKTEKVKRAFSAIGG
jgi:hypothetical protein